MAFQLIFNKRDIPKTDAVVTFKRQRFFGPRAGTVEVSGENPVQIRAVAHRWKGDTLDLIGRAGYTLNNNNKFGMIISFFIRRRYYDLYDINNALEKFDQKLLGV